MPAYLISHRAGQRGDMLVEDPALTLDIQDGWAILADDTGICAAIPADTIASIQRIGPDDSTPGRPEPAGKPRPLKE